MQQAKGMGKLINNTLSSLASGVTQQYQEGRFDSQVTAMNNCMPNITRGVLRRNPLKAVKLLEGLPTDLTDSYVYTYDRGTTNEQYIVVIPGDGTISVYNANDGELLYNKTGDSYLMTPAGSRAKETFKAITIGDHSFIVNTTITVGFTSKLSPVAGYADMAFYWVKKTASVVTNQVQTGSDPITTGSLMKGYGYTLNNLFIQGLEDNRPGFPEVHMNTSKEIAAEFVRDTNPDLSFATKVEGSICYNDAFTEADWKWEDTFGNEASIGVWKAVEDSSKLPANLPPDLGGFLVKVSGGTSAQFDDYYLQYLYDEKKWTEVCAPGVLVELDETTMPHVLYRLAETIPGTPNWELNTYQGVVPAGDALDGISKWGERLTGGESTLDDPSFVGQSINNLFFFKNRLGILTNDSVILSMTGEYGNFFVQTLQEQLEDDPIDLSVASTDVTILRHAVPTAGQLILFADDTQFALESVDGPMTPKSADISALSNYTYGKRADARAIGNKVYFGNQSGGYSQLYAYRVTDQGSKLTEGVPLTVHIPTYIDKSLVNIVGHDVLGYIFLETEANPNELVVLTSVVRGTEEMQNAFHKWKFSRDIISTNIINNNLYILFADSSLTYMSLEVPGSIDDIEYLDEYQTTQPKTNYISEIEFSEFFYRDSKGKGTVRGRYQIRTLKYTIEESSRYRTDIYNTDYQSALPANAFGPIWYDVEVWDDALIWADVNPNYIREYVDDDKITVLSNSKKVRIKFLSSNVAPEKGFELSTANIEAFFMQRSQRTQ